MVRSLFLAAVALLFGAVPAARDSHYLFVWAMEVRHPDSHVCVRSARSVAPAARRAISQRGPYMYPHSFVYLSNGHTLATFQYTRGFNRGRVGSPSSTLAVTSSK
jgi:hypothetical protein